MTIPQPDAADAQAIREFFRTAGFTETAIAGKLGAGELNVRIPEERLTHFYNTAEPTPLNWLIRWFMIGASMSRDDAERGLPPDILSRLLRAGFLVEDGGVVRAPLRVAPFDDLLLASDHVGKLPPELAGELVTGVSTVARRLLRCTVRQPTGRVLDFGAGCGVQALYAARHAEHVIGVDLNPRALEYSRLNATLNGIANVEFRQGDGLAPVAGETFDQIIANPPFFITPASSLMLRENDMELDDFCRTLLRDAAAQLSEAGTLQMVCEWVEIEGQTWQQRMEAWVDGTGCDAWVLKLYTNSLVEYAERRTVDYAWDHPARRQPYFDEWMAYHKDRKVTKIDGGLIALRRRAGVNWTVCNEGNYATQEMLGQHVVNKFTAEDFLSATGDRELLEVKPTLAPAVKMESVHTHQQQSWTPESIRLTPPHDAADPVQVDSPTSLFLSYFDGKTSIVGAAAQLASDLQADPRAVQGEAVKLARRFLKAGILLPPKPIG